MVVMAGVVRRWAFMEERRAVGRGWCLGVAVGKLVSLMSVVVGSVVGWGRGIRMRGGGVVVVGEEEEREVVECGGMGAGWFGGLAGMPVWWFWMLYLAGGVES